jgi:hypothetical protein
LNKTNMVFLQSFQDRLLFLCHSPNGHKL